VWVAFFYSYAYAYEVATLYELFNERKEIMKSYVDGPLVARYPDADHLGVQGGTQVQSGTQEHQMATGVGSVYWCSAQLSMF
jgi:hypothetical protein